jgi:hypothetical protein
LIALRDLIDEAIGDIDLYEKPKEWDSGNEAHRLPRDQVRAD